MVMSGGMGVGATLEQLREERKKGIREQRVPQSGGPQPYYYGLPTPRGQPMLGSAPARDRDLWMQALRGFPQQFFEEPAVGALRLGEKMLNVMAVQEAKAPLVENYIDFRQKQDPNYRPSLSWASEELQQEFRDRTQQRLDYGQKTIIPASAFSDKTKVLPFTNKSLGQTVQDVALGFGPIDIGVPLAIAKFGRPASKLLGSAGTVLSNSSKGYSYAAPTQAVQKLGIDAARGGLKVGQMITEPISRSDNLFKRYLVEQAVDTAARTAFEYNPVFGIGGIAALPVTKGAIRGVKGLYKKITGPTFDDHIQAARSNVENILRPHRIEGTPEYQKKILDEQFKAVPSGAAVDEPKRSVDGIDTEVTMSGGSTDPRLKQGGEFYKYDAKIKLIDANDVKTSHDPYTETFEPLDPKDFPTERQNRNRFKDATEREKFREDRILGFDPNKLMFDTGAMQTGLPIISDGYVDAGNGRVIALKVVKLKHPEKYKEYLEILRNSLKKYGIAPEELDKFGPDEIPMLVRERTTEIPEDLIKAYVVDGNLDEIEALSDLELADVIVEAWNENTLLRLIPTGKGIEDTLKAESNAEIITELQTVLGKHPRAKNWFVSGRLTPEGIKVFRQALYVKVFGRNNAAFLINEIDTLPKGEIKNVFNSVDEALPQLAVIRGQTIKSQKSGLVQSEYDVSDNLIQSMQTYRSLKNDKIPINNFLNQYNMDPDIGMQKQFIRLFNGVSSPDKNVRASSKQIATVLEVYAKQVSERAGQIDMFSGSAPDKYALLEAAIDQTMPGVLPTRQLQLEIDQTQTKIGPDNPNYDPDLDVSDELKLTDKEKKVVEKEVRKEMKIEKDKPTPAYGENKLESDKSPKNTDVSKDNIDQPEIGTKYDDQIPTSGEQRNVKNVDEILPSTPEPQAIKARKGNRAESDIVFSSGIANKTFGIRTIVTGLDPIRRGINSMLKIVDMAGIPVSKYAKPESYVEGVFDQINDTMNIAGGIRSVLSKQLSFQAKKVFKFRKDGVTIDYSSLKPGAPKIIITNPDKPLLGEVVERERTFADTLAAYPEMKPFLYDEQIEFIKIWELKMKPMNQTYAEVLAADGRSFNEVVGKRQDIQPDGIYVSRGGADEFLDEPLRMRNGRYKKRPDFLGRAVFNSQAEGIYRGFEYDDLETALNKYIGQVAGESLDVHVRTSLRNFTDANGEKLAFSEQEVMERVDPDLAEKLKIINKKRSKMARISKFYEDRVDDHIQNMHDEIHDAGTTIDDVRKNFKAILAAGPTKGATKEELEFAVEQLDKEYISVKKLVKNFRNKLEKGNGFYKELKGVKIKELEGLYFNERNANSLSKFYRHLEGESFFRRLPGYEKVRMASTIHLMTTSTLDDSAVLIQGQYALWHKPEIWGKALKSNIKTIMDPDELTKYTLSVDKLAEETGGFTVQEMVRYFGINLQGSEFTTFFKNSEKLNKQMDGRVIGKIEQTLTKWASELDAVNMENPEYDQSQLLLGPIKLVRWGSATANRMFDTMLQRVRIDVAQRKSQELFQAGLTKEQIIEKYAKGIGDFANTMTGTTYIDRRYGWQTDLGSILLYAPRYLYSRMKWMAMAMRGSVPIGSRSHQSKTAALTFWKQVMWMTNLTVLINDLQGHDTDFRPIIKQHDGTYRVNSNFVRLRVGDSDFNLLGLATKEVALFYGMIILAKEGKFDEAGLNFLRLKGSGLIRIANDYLFNKEFDGSPIRNKEDPVQKRILDTMLYVGDQYQPFSIQDIPDNLRDDNKALILPKAIGNMLGATEAPLSYKDKLIEKAREAGLDYTRLEPYRKRQFDREIKDTMQDYDDGLWRNLATELFGYASPQQRNSYDIADTTRLNREDDFYRWFKNKKDDNGDKYTGYDFVNDMTEAKNFYYGNKQGIEWERNLIYDYDQSIEENEENVEALNQWYEVFDIFLDEDTKLMDKKVFEIQSEFLLKGREVVIQDKDGEDVLVGGWNRDQLAYVNRNTNLLYHKPEILTELIKQGKRWNVGKFWIANLIKSRDARLEFERRGSPGSVVDPNATFIWDSRQPIPSFILRGGQIKKTISKMPEMDFLQYLNIDREPAGVGAGTSEVPGVIPWPTTSPYYKPPE